MSKAIFEFLYHLFGAYDPDLYYDEELYYDDEL